MEHAEQGPLCESVFQSSCDGYTIYKNYYNLFATNSYPPVYETTRPVTIRMNIPKTLLATDRDFRMICVSRLGMPYVLMDEDSSSDTITFTTNHFYAFALVYKDIKKEPVSTVTTAPVDTPVSSVLPATESQTTVSVSTDAAYTRTGYALYTPVVYSYMDKTCVDSVVQDPDALIL